MSSEESCGVVIICNMDLEKSSLIRISVKHF